MQRRIISGDGASWRHLLAGAIAAQAAVQSRKINADFVPDMFAITW